jgi:hypothetical protein
VGVYPNPADDEAFLRIYSPSAIDLKCTVTDISGRIVMTRQMNGVTLVVERFDTQALASGVYFVKVEGININPVSRKLVVQK